MSPFSWRRRRRHYHDDGDTEDDHGQDRDRDPGPPAAELEPGSELLGPPAFGGLRQQRAQQPGPLGAGRPQIRPRPRRRTRASPARASLAGRLRGPAWRGPGSRVRGGAARGVLRQVIEFESGHGELVVIGPRLRRRGQRLAHRRGVPETPRLAARGVAASWVLVAARLAGLGPLGSPAWPGAPPLELEPGGGPAPGITACWIGGGRNSRDGAGGGARHGAGGGTRHGAGGGARHGAGGGTRDGAGGGARRLGARGPRGVPGAVSLGMAGRFPCHLCLAVFGTPPEKSAENGGINLESPYAISPPIVPAGIGRDRDFGARRGRERPRRCRE